MTILEKDFREEKLSLWDITRMGTEEKPKKYL